MRSDKFLKVSRIIKRRTVAKEVCDGGKVKINGRVAKAGTDVAAGDEIEIDFDSGVIHNLTRNESYQAAPFPPFIQNIMKNNGLMNAIRKGED